MPIYNQLNCNANIQRQSHYYRFLSILTDLLFSISLFFISLLSPATTTMHKVARTYLYKHLSLSYNSTIYCSVIRAPFFVSETIYTESAIRYICTHMLLTCHSLNLFCSNTCKFSVFSYFSPLHSVLQLYDQSGVTSGHSRLIHMCLAFRLIFITCFRL